MFLDRYLEGLLYQPAVQRLQEAIQRGDFTMILSSGPDFLVDAIAVRLKVSCSGATHYEVDSEQRFSDLSSKIEGEEKAVHVVALAYQLGIPRDRISAYTDSYLDLPLLLQAGKAVAVRPDRRLRRLSLRNEWEIL